MRDKPKPRPRSPRRWTQPLALVLAAGLGSGPAGAVLELRNASVERLENGLTLILLEDRNFPVASMQALYRVGARNESTGKTGLAHFVEHMAFRHSENFPNTGLVRSIYACGGEWHGYTWTDQTTYYATVPAEDLDLLLRIEADRMARIVFRPEDMEAERGAVLAELHGYEDSPAAMLLDAVMFASFQAHPYRNNTIGWASDVEHLEHADVVEFYRRHYHPANAILAVVGDFDPSRVRGRVGELFGGLERRPPTPPPHTLEPIQTGERRVRLSGPAPQRRFMIGYRAPAVSSPDFAPFLVLQQILGGGSGVSFLQNDWGTPVAPGAALDGAADGLTTWYPPSAQDYLFVVGGAAPDGVSEAEVEREIEVRIAAARGGPPDPETLDAAIQRVLDELIYDVETTEDAAHQLAFFAGLDALEVLLGLPAQVRAVNAAQVHRAAARYLPPQRRTIAWHEPAAAAAEPGLARAARSDAPPQPPPAPVDRVPVPAPTMTRLRSGLPVILQPSDLSPAAHLRVVLGGGDGSDPILFHSSLGARLRPDGLPAAVAGAQALLQTALAANPVPPRSAADPAARLEGVFLDLMGGGPGAVTPAAVVLSGDVAVDAALPLLERHFGDVVPAPPTAPRAIAFEPGEQTLVVGHPVAQAQLGYIVPAPPPGAPTTDAWRLLLYVLSHDYEGRLGHAAISARGLAYYIDSRYRSDGASGWITLAVGVDPAKIEPLRTLLRAELARLASDPPTAAEVAEAKAHLVGRARSAAQSNEELTGALARQLLWHGGPQTPEALARRLADVTPADVLAAVPAFSAGRVVVVRE